MAGLQLFKTRKSQSTIKEDLIGRQVICVTNFAPKQIANFVSEVLTCGFADENCDIVLAETERNVQNGAKLI